MDLTSTAAANSAARRSAADDLIRTDPSGRLARFRRLAGTSVFSTNVTADKIVAYDRANQVLDTRRVRVRQAGGDVAAGLREFARGAWARRREAFEDLWEHGREFVYGAVNAGGMGAERYEQFCLVVTDPGADSPTALAVFPHDTAQRYTDPPDVVHEADAVRDATPWSERASLAVIERHTEVGDEAGWPRVICSRDRYLEVDLAPGPATSAVAEVRMRADYVAELRLLRARELAGDDLSGREKTQAEAYDVIRSWRRSLGTTIVEVDSP